MAVKYVVTSISNVFTQNGIEVSSMSLGGNDPNGFLTPSDVILGCAAGARSPQLLQLLVEQTSHKVVIKGYRPDVQGIQRNFLTITLVGARVLSHQSAGSSQGDLTDRLHLNFVTLEYDFVENGVDYIWQAPA